jgi:predicted lipoprotein with Yx(FWY)xxD motif
MMRLITPGMAIAAALALGACGGGGGGGSSAVSGGAASDTVSVRQLPGVGSVLVDQSGRALYSSDQEASGKIVCDSSCTAFWKPLSPGGSAPKAAAGAGKLGVIKRPDGSMQVTAGGRPLYTFAEDSPGKATGDGFSDNFSGHHFTWHVVRSGGKTTSGAGSGGGGNPYGKGGSSGGY